MQDLRSFKLVDGVPMHREQRARGFDWDRSADHIRARSQYDAWLDRIRTPSEPEGIEQGEAS
jgi:hypothetical protein